MVCASCGAPRRSRSPLCAECGHPFSSAGRADKAAPAASRGPRRRTTRYVDRAAAAPHIALAIAIDVLICFSPLILTLVFLGRTAVACGLVLFSALVLAQASALLFDGRTVGLLLAGIRVVLEATGSAPGWRRNGWRLADVRRGVDPITPRHSVPTLASLSAHAAPTDATHRPSTSPARSALPPSREARKSSSVLVVDDHAHVPVTSALLIGRAPSARDGAMLVAIPDLSRQLSKAHFLINPLADGMLTITDLASTNGTVVNGAELTPSRAYAVRDGDEITAGGHRFRVEPRMRHTNGVPA